MSNLSATAPAFVEMAHQIVWCSVATVDTKNRPRNRILHPIWEWDGSTLSGWIATIPTPTKRAHLDHSPYVSCGYWTSNHDSAIAECRATWAFDDATCTEVWNRLKNGPAPVGYDPGAIGVPGWDGPTADAFAVLQLEPWRLRVMPGTVMLRTGGELLTWQASG